MAKITVISQKGKLVGTWMPPQGTVAGGPVSVPVVGLGQKLHEIEVGDPESYVRHKALPELHQMVKKRLRLK